MGKIILSERQYSELKKSLVSHSIKESINNKSNLRFINEAMNNDQRLAAELAGKKLQGILKKCHNAYDSKMVGCINDITAQMNTLKSKEQYDEAAKYMSYWHVNNWAATLNEVLHDFLYDEEGITGPQSIEFANQFATIFKKVGGNLTYKKVVRNEEYAWGDRSFNLSWPAVTNAGLINQRYWDALTTKTNQKYGAKSAGTGNDEFLYWGMWVIRRNMNSNDGYPISVGTSTNFSSSTDFQFQGKQYTGGALETTNVIPYGSKTPITFTKMVETYKGTPTKNVTTTPKQPEATQPKQPQATTQKEPTPQTPKVTQQQPVQTKSSTDDVLQKYPNLSYLDEF